MGPLAILALSVGLAMDSTAVAAARGLSAPSLRARDVVVIGLMMGGFQAGMPLLGWLVGAQVGPWVVAVDHWIAFGVLLVLGGKMIKEALGGGDDDEEAVDATQLFAVRALVPLAVATSIDAFAVGVTLPMMRAPIAATLACIGIVTAVLSGAGCALGRRAGAAFGPRLEVVGGIALIVVGARILIDHLSTGT